MEATAPLQLPLLSGGFELGQNGEERLRGLWSAGERWLGVGARSLCAAAWFEFKESGAAVLSVRQDGRDALHRVHGRWWLEARELVVTLGDVVIRAPWTESNGVLYWADETLVRRDRTKR